MGYDLCPRNKELEEFHFSSFSFPLLIEACGYLFACVHNGSQYCFVPGVDKRMPVGDTYPRLLSNDRFPVTAEEARIMARIARNFVAIQRTLPDENKPDDARSKMEWRKEDLLAALNKGMFGAAAAEPWPVKIREDWTNKFEEFADWADKSGGFTIG
jgi:hypothetical protein